MPSLLQRLRGGDRDTSRSSWYQDHFTFNGQAHPLYPPKGSLPGAPAEHIGRSFEDQVYRVRDQHGIVAAAVHARSLLVSQLRFAWRDESTNRVFGNGDLAPLERPGSVPRPMLLTRLEEDVCWAGNAYVRRIGNRLYRLRPDWVDLVDRKSVV